MRTKFMLLTLTAGVLSVSGLSGSWADEQTAGPEPDSQPSQAQPAPDAVQAAPDAEEGITLGDLRSFEIPEFEVHEFSTEQGSVPPEIGQFARTAIQGNQLLRYSSPGEGFLRFRCEGYKGFGCGRIRAEVTAGTDGPVVWSTVRTYDPFFTVFEPNPRRFAREVVGQLGEDYRKAMKAVPMKIQIKEGE